MKVTRFAAGLAVGYVLGARAGRGKYEQITGQAQALRANPTAAQARAAIVELLSKPKATPTLPTPE